MIRQIQPVIEPMKSPDVLSHTKSSLATPIFYTNGFKYLDLKDTYHVGHEVVVVVLLHGIFQVQRPLLPWASQDTLADQEYNLSRIEHYKLEAGKSL